MRKGLFKFWIPEFKLFLCKPLWDRSLSGEQEARHFSQRNLEYRCGRREKGGAMQNLPESTGEFCVGCRVRAHYIERTRRVRVFHHPDEGPDDVIPVYPGHVLCTASQAPAKSKFEGQYHTFQKATARACHHSGP